MGRPKGSKNKINTMPHREVIRGVASNPVVKPVVAPIVANPISGNSFYKPSPPPIEKKERGTPEEREYREYILQYHADIEKQVKRVADSLDKILAFINKQVREKND